MKPNPQGPPLRPNSRWNRRHFLSRATAAAVGGLALPGWTAEPDPVAKPPGPASADAVILVWMPGGITQADTWDPKRFTPYRPGMLGSEMFSTCESIPTAADGIRLGQGLENLAGVMDRACVVRSLTNRARFGALHLKAQHYLLTGYIPPVGVKPPSLGSVVARTLGRRHPQVPPYIYIGRDLDTNDEEKLFIHETIGPGFYGPEYAPFLIPDPAAGLATLETAAGMPIERLDRRLQLLRSLHQLAHPRLQEAEKANRYVGMMNQARAMMDSPIKQAFDYWADEKPETIEAYDPGIEATDQLDPSYYFGRRFGHGLLLARRLVETGARFVQVEYQYGPFKGFDMHENGARRMVEMKLQFDRQLTRLIRDLEERGLLARTLVVVATEFGRTVASAPSAGREPEGFAEEHTGENLVIESERMYGLHGHFSSSSAALFFGGGFKGGHVHGRTADHHPMVAVEDPVSLEDLHATLYQALGIAPDHGYITEGRPFYVTKDGKGRPVNSLLA